MHVASNNIISKGSNTAVTKDCNIKFKEGYAFVAVATVEGPILNVTRVSRKEMGPYLCIASNGIPPSVSKRIMLIVHCK